MKFKVFLEEDQRQRIKTIKLPLQTLSIDHLEAQIVKCFKAEPEGLKKMTLCHQDKEKDLIITTAISSDEELHRAISAFVTSKRTVCLRVTMKNSSSSKKENEATTPAVVEVDANSEGCSRSNTTVSVNMDRTEDERMSSLQLSEIEAKGFANKRQNIRLLKKHNGNVDKVIQVLTELSAKRQKRMEKRKSATRLPDDEPSDHEARNNKNAQPQVKLEGAADESSRATSSISATDEENLESLLRELEIKGFAKKKQSSRLLRKHNGDVDRVIQVLTNKSAKRQESMMNATDEDSLGSVLCELEAKGFSNKRLNVRLLKKNDHNVDKVIQVLTQASDKRQEKRKNRVNKLQAAYEELSPLLSELETKGFTNKRKNIRLLRKHDNEVGKVLQILSGRRQDILACREARLALKGTKQEQINQAA